MLKSATLLVIAIIAEISGAEDVVDIRGQCRAGAADLLCSEPEMPAVLADWIFREESEQNASAEKYGRGNPGNEKCYDDADVVRVNGDAATKLSSLEVNRFRFAFFQADSLINKSVRFREKEDCDFPTAAFSRQGFVFVSRE